MKVWEWLRGSVGVKKGIEVWERIMSGERVWYEQKGRGYSVGDDPPHVRMCVYGKWVDVMDVNPIVDYGGY